MILLPNTPPSLSRKISLKNSSKTVTSPSAGMIVSPVHGGSAPSNSASQRSFSGSLSDRSVENNADNSSMMNHGSAEKISKQVAAVRLPDHGDQLQQQKNSPDETLFVELTTGLLSLSVHEESAFNGTEIALHPDLFANFNTAIHLSHQQYRHKQHGCMPGDLLEIRVWDAVKDFSSAKFATSKVLRPNNIIGRNSNKHPPSGTAITTSSSSSSSSAIMTENAADTLNSPCINQGGHHEESSLGESSKTTTTAATPTHNDSPLPYFFKANNDFSSSASNILMEFPLSVSLSSSSLINTNSGGNCSSKANNGVLMADEKGMSKLNNAFHNSRVCELRTSFVMKVGKHFALKENSRSQISVLRQVAELYNLSAFDTVTVTKIDKRHHEEVLKHVSTDFMMVTIKDQFISRGEMFHYHNSLLGKWVFCGERLTSQDGVRAIAKEIRHADKIIKAGIVTKETKITFRSRSARIIWVVQISTEMWDYASPYESSKSKCQIYFDKFVQFMYRLFEKWKELEVTHSLTVLFFSRTNVLLQKQVQPNQGSTTSFADMSSVQSDSEGRLYQDHYKMVVENETRTDWESLVLKIKRAFLEYPHNVGWNISSESESRIPSTAAQGNVLEAINVTMNVLSMHYIDRDLHRTGNSIVVISAGNGVFEVEKKIAGITKQRMMDNGIGSDMLCLGLPPLHVAPFFLYKEVAPSETFAEEKTWFDDWKTFFEIPHWMNLSFVEYDPDKSFHYFQSTANTSDAALYSNAVGPNAFAYSVESARSIRAHPSWPSHRYPQKVSKIALGEMSQQRDLISCRDFEDIVEACRPRYRAYDSIACLPSALRALLHKTSLMRNAGLVSANNDNVIDNSVCQNSGALRDIEENSFLAEWGAVDFDSVKDMSLKKLASFSSPIESLPSATENVLFDFTGSSEGKMLEENASQLNVLQIQKQKSFPLTSEVIGRSHSLSIAKLKLMMEHYDANIFSSMAKKSMHPDISSNRRLERASSFLENVAPQKLVTSTNANQKNGIGDALKGFTASGHAVMHQTSTLRKVYSSKNFQSAGGYSPFNLTIPNGPSSLSRGHAGGNLKLPVRRMPIAVEPPDELDAVIEPNLETDISKSLSDVEFLGDLGDRLSSQVATERIGPVYGSPSSLVSLSLLGAKNRRASSGHLRQKRDIGSMRRFPSHDSKPWVLNPFRQQDEDEMLSKRTHNRRRWSHVFPPGEAEFKRHSGPLWNSLCQPAVLPLSTDYLPEEYELNDPEKFEFNHYNIFIDAMDRSYYSSYSELLNEMVMQRIIQDYQIVSESVLDERRQSAEFKKKSRLQEMKEGGSDVKRSGPRGRISNLASVLLAQSSETTVQHILSMGHNIVYLRYNKNSDVIEVVQYHAKFAQNDDSSNTYTYRYLLWMPLSADFQPVSLAFNKFGSLYRWNRLDNLICGDPSKVGLSEDFRFRRIGFGIIPDVFDDPGKEQEYVLKFLRLLDYLKKLVSQKDAPEMDVKVVSACNRQEDALDSKYINSADRVKRFIVQLRKGTRDKYEWLELVLDATFDTQQAFRIEINWLVASGSKVEALIQLLIRRCSQYGLRIVQLPNYANSSTLYLHPFIAPRLISIENRDCGRVLEEQFNSKFQFVFDGKRWVDPTDIPGAPDFQFPIKRGKRTRIVGRQYVHRSGVAFIRAFDDEKGCAIFLWLQNRFLTGPSENMQAQAVSLLNDLKAHVAATCIK